MSQAPFMPLFTDAYLADTMHLTLEEHGAYLKLLMVTWRNNGLPLPDDDARMARTLGVTPKRWAKLRPVLAEFFDLTDGSWRQKRLEKEWEVVARQREARRQNGAKGGRPKEGPKSDAEQRPTNAKHEGQNATRQAPIEPGNTLENNDTEKATGSFQANLDESTHTHTHTHETPDGVSPCSPPRSPKDGKGTVIPLTAFGVAPAPDPDGAQAMVDMWNAVALDLGLAQVQKLTEARKAKARARLKDCGGLEGWRAALDKIRSIPGLLGQNGRGWKADFDFLMQEGKFVKLMEGGYDHWSGASQGGGQRSGAMNAAFDGLEAENRARAEGVWP